jgi:hypothetical protein
MAEHRTYPLLPEDKCLTEEQLFAYIDGRLPDAERHLAEKHMLDCPLCSDALEGLLLVKNRDKVAAAPFFPGNGSGTKEEKEATRVIPLHRNRRSLYAIAAAVVLLLGVTVVMKLALNNDYGADLAQAPEEQKLDAPGKDLLSMDSSVATTDKLEQDNKQVAAFEQETAAGDAPADEPAQNGPGSGATTTGKLSEADDLQQPNTVMKAADANVGEKTEEGFSTTEDKRTAPLKDASVKAETRLEEAKEKDKLIVLQKTDRGDSKNNKKQTAPEAAGTSAPPSPTGGATSGTSQSGAPDSGTDDLDVYERTQADSTSSPKLYRNLATDEDLDLCYENGVKMLDSGQAAASITFFDQVLANPSHRYFEDAQWKKVDALLKLNRNAEAKTLLNEIVKKGGKYKTQAKEKLKKL